MLTNNNMTRVFKKKKQFKVLIKIDNQCQMRLSRVWTDEMTLIMKLKETHTHTILKSLYIFNALYNDSSN